MDEENKGVKDPKENGEGADSNNQSDAGDGVIAPDDASKKADELLDKPLSKEEKRVVEKDRFNEINDKAKAYDTFAPVLEKLKDKPEIIDNLLNSELYSTRISNLEEEAKARKRTELKGALTYALESWPGFDREWGELREDVDRLMKKGLGAKDAMRRSYLALHPEAVQGEAERMAKEAGNSQGVFSSGGTFVPKIKLDNKNKGKELTPGERAVAKQLGKSEEDYAVLLTKHDGWLRAKGFYDPALEQEL